MSKTIVFPIAAALAVLAGLAAPVSATAADSEALGFERTPPRLSFVDGDVSFYRSGAQDWSEAEVNTPLTAGDELYAAEGANLEVQIGPRAYMRAGEETQVGLDSLEPDFLQLRVTEGHVSLDLRTLSSGQTFEVDTPNAAFTIERSGYYRVAVEGDTTTFVSRRGGRASITSAQGATTTIAPSEQVVITGTDAPQIETYAAPELDDWDRWNYARTDGQIDAVSARYVPSGVYGVDDLDHNGDWRVVPTYGAIWVPRGVAVGWAPYTTGRWLYDPYYGWSWVDVAPWGWAPYHYGRWVYVSGYWGWAPGPLVVRPYYSPALVAFFGGGGVSVGISVGVPFPYIGWVALGWGEPLVPWWGPRGCRGVPRWGGWGGPRYVNKVVIHNEIHVHDIHEYEHQRRRDAFVAMDRKEFGRRHVREGRLASVEPDKFRRFEGDLDVRPSRESLTPSDKAGRRPSRDRHERQVVATREPRRAPMPELEGNGRGERREERAEVRREGQAEQPRGEARREGQPEAPRAEARREGQAEAPHPEPKRRVVERSSRPAGSRTFERPPFAKRGEAERATPPPAPRYRKETQRETAERAAPATPERTQRERAATPTPERAQRERAATPTPERAQRERAATPTPERAQRERAATPAPAARTERPRDLPGEPANRVYRRESRQGAAASGASRKQAPQSRQEAVPQGGGGGETRSSPGGGGSRGNGGGGGAPRGDGGGGRGGRR